MGKSKRAALYVRVSTDGQTTVNQERELREVAERHGWNVVAVHRDHAVSGRNGREKRPGLDRLLHAVSRKEGVGENLCGLLTDTIHATGALDQTDDGPRQVEVHDDGAILEVLAFT